MARDLDIGISGIGIADNRKVVTTAATRVPLVAASTPAFAVIVTAETNNTGVIAVGGATVVATVLTRQGTPLFAGGSVTLIVDDLADVYIDATVSTEGVTFTYMT